MKCVMYNAMGVVFIDGDEIAFSIIPESKTIAFHLMDSTAVKFGDNFKKEMEIFHQVATHFLYMGLFVETLENIKKSLESTFPNLQIEVTTVQEEFKKK